MSSIYQLWCIVDGENIPFFVRVSPTLDISELKAIIKEKIETHHPAYKHVLWKPSNMIPVMPSKTLAQRLGLELGVSQIAEKLDPAALVAHYFQSQDPIYPYLNVIVQFPASTRRDEPPSKRQRLVDDHDSYLEKMKQFWKSLWQDKQDPSHDLTVSRGSDPIDAIDIPPTMKVLHLSSAVSALDAVMIRSDYEEALRDIDNMAYTGEKNSVIIIGHPGIGKTILLYYILVRRLLEQKPTILQKQKESLLFFHSEGVEVLSPSTYVDATLDKYQNAWALVDINVHCQSPAVVLGGDGSPFFLVMASCPRPSPLRELEKHRRPCDYWLMKPFTLAETIQARQLQRAPFNDPKESDIQRFFQSYGPSARDCYHYCKPSALETYHIDVRGKVQSIGWDLIKEVTISHLAHVKMEEGSHKVLLIEPQPENRGKARTTIISGTVSQLLWDRDSDQQWKNHRAIFRTLAHPPPLLVGPPDAKRSFCGKFFEPAFHALCIRDTTTMLKCYQMYVKPLKPGGEPNFTFMVPDFESGCGLPVSKNFELKLGGRRRFSFHKEDNPITSLDSEHYYHPTLKNSPSLDSFVYDLEAHEIDRINLFQFTVAKHHDLLSAGVKEVRELGERLGIDLMIRIIVVVCGKVDVEFKVQRDMYEDWNLDVYIAQVTERHLYPH